nr:uncharacterized protein LOC129382367 [Dermacentor andersoni]
MQTLTFTAEARKLYNNMMCRGFGLFLDENDDLTKPELNLLFKEIYISLLSATYPEDEITNFAMYPVPAVFREEERDKILNIRPYLGLLVFMAWRQDNPNNIVECIASWNNIGMPGERQPTFMNRTREVLAARPDLSVAWAAIYVSKSISPEHCGGTAHRLKRIHELNYVK